MYIYEANRPRQVVKLKCFTKQMLRACP